MNWDLSTAYKVLNKDPHLKIIIKETGKLDHTIQKDLFTSLLKAIVSQQLSTKAADTIWGRFITLFDYHQPEAEALLLLDTELMRSAGLSYQKAGYLKNIATFSLEKTLDYRKLHRKSDEELITYLSSIKGVGRWTAEMILMFNLNRPDVLPVDDLGIQQAMKALYDLKEEGKELKIKMIEISNDWKPYRSLASRHLWRWKDF